jgi:hypothetical protein
MPDFESAVAVAVEDLCQDCPLRLLPIGMSLFCGEHESDMTSESEASRSAAKADVAATIMLASVFNRENPTPCLEPSVALSEGTDRVERVCTAHDKVLQLLGNMESSDF